MKSIALPVSPPAAPSAAAVSVTGRVLKVAAAALIVAATYTAFHHNQTAFSSSLARKTHWRDYFAIGNAPTLQCSQHPADSHMPIGKHYLLDFYNVPRQNLDFLETEQVYDTLSSYILKAGMTILDWSGHRFECGGMTGIFLLSESHVSFHSWPEHDFIAFDVYTCGNGRPDLIVESLEKLLKPGRVERTLIERGNYRQTDVERISYTSTGLDSTSDDDALPKAAPLPTGNFHYPTEQAPAISKKVADVEPKNGPFRNPMNITDLVVDMCVNFEVPSDDCFLLKNVVVKADVQSKYQHIQVADTQSFDRCMFLDNIVQFCESDNHIYTTNIVDKAIAPFLESAKESSLSVQIVGGGDGWVASYILDKYSSTFNKTDVNIVDIDPMVTEVTMLHFDPAGASSSFEDPRVHWTFDDARKFLADTALARDNTMEMVIIDSTDHTVKSSQGLYSTAFYHDVWRILKKGGAGSKPGKLVQQMNTEDEDYAEFLAEADQMWTSAGFKNLVKWKVYIPSFGGNCIYWMADAE